jgi:hypothetical protein
MQDINKEHLEGAKSGNAKDIQTIYDAFKPAVYSCAAKLRADGFDFEDADETCDERIFFTAKK